MRLRHALVTYIRLRARARKLKLQLATPSTVEVGVFSRHPHPLSSLRSVRPGTSAIGIGLGRESDLSGSEKEGTLIDPSGPFTDVRDGEHQRHPRASQSTQQSMFPSRKSPHTLPLRPMKFGSCSRLSERCCATYFEVYVAWRQGPNAV